MDTINWCNLKDMGFVGPNFTWLYQTTDGVQIQERLDRVYLQLGGWNSSLLPNSSTSLLTLDNSPFILAPGKESP